MILRGNVRFINLYPKLSNVSCRKVAFKNRLFQESRTNILIARSPLSKSPFHREKQYQVAKNVANAIFTEPEKPLMRIMYFWGINTSVINSLGEDCYLFCFVLFCFFFRSFFPKSFREFGQDIRNFVQLLRLFLLLLFNYSEKLLLQNLSKKPGVVGSNLRVWCDQSHKLVWFRKISRLRQIDENKKKINKIYYFRE